MTTGIYSLEDLRAVKYASAAEFGLDTINKTLQAELANYNAQMREQMMLLAEPLTEQSRIYGTSGIALMAEVDEFGKGVSQKDSVGVTVSFPLKVFAAALGWTEKHLQMATPAEMAEKMIKVQKGYAAAVTKAVKQAIFNNTNYNFTDHLVNGVTLGVKRLINADGSVIPNSPSGATFDGSTHTHYLARAAALANSDIDGAISTVTEHGNTHGLKMFVNLSNKAAVTALSKFKALDSALLAYSGVTSTITKLNTNDFENQMIGYWDGYVEVWVKPWVPANYILVAATEEPEKLLGYRELPQPSMQGLRIDAPFGIAPLVAQNAEAIFGFGVWNRLAGSVLYIGGTTWTNPTI
jgi:hypothetical protein